jgi:hypothetical protein
MRPATLPRPRSFDDEHGPAMWVDEAIWGHRLHDEQTPWLAFLEFLNVLRSESEAGRAFMEPDGPNTLRYRPYRRLHLRNILFNNPRLDAILKEFPDDKSRWQRWLRDMEKNADGLGDRPDFNFIRGHFASFEDFALTASLLRSTAVEGESNKRWTSKFVFPYGPAALYEDLNVRPTSMTNDRRFFGRVGEVVYLMLCRSGHGEKLREELCPLLLTEDSRWNRLLRTFSPERPEDLRHRANPYLPYSELPEFRMFAEDWLSLLRCQMPGYDVMPHLVDLLGLHVLLYKLNRARAWIEPGHPVRLVLEIISPRRTTIRDLAGETYLINNTLSRQAVDNYIRETVEHSPEWQQALQDPDPYGAALKTLESKVAWPDPEKYEGPHTPQGLLHSKQGLIEAAQRRHAGHVANVHSRYASAIGLASRRGTRKTRYAPNDRFLKSLVFASVPRRHEFQHFLHLIHERYGFIVGHRQATDYVRHGQSDQTAFEDNARRLELRLASLGLLRRLSDACAYVENPFARRSP